MAEIKWIKITTNMFEDEKIDFIESLPEGDAVLVIWIKLLTLAGKVNDKGRIYLTEEIAFTDDMLAHRFRRSASVVKMALQTLEKLKMITILEDGFMKITNWEKHQNVDGMEKIREQTRKRVAKHREKKALEQKHQEDKSSNVTGNVTVTQSNATDEEIDEETDEETDIDEEIDDRAGIYAKFIESFNKMTKKNESLTSSINRQLDFYYFNYGSSIFEKAVFELDKSNYLKKGATLFWFVENLKAISNGKYRDFKSKEKKNNFSNFTGQSEDYSLEELDRIAREQTKRRNERH